MLTNTELVRMERSLRDKHVLSVYVDRSVTDFAAPRMWRVNLEHSLKDLRTWLADSSHDEREEFERCVTLLEATLPPFTGGIGSHGWAAFITQDAVRYAEPLPVPMPTLAAVFRGGVPNSLA